MPRGRRARQGSGAQGARWTTRGRKVGDTLDAVRACLRDEGARLTALAIAVLLVLGGVARSYMELALSAAQGRFPMPGDNVAMLAACVAVCAVAAAGPRRLVAALGGMAGRACACALALVSTALLAVACLVPDVPPAPALSIAGVLARTASLLGLIVLCALARPRGVAACAAQMALGLALAVLFDVVCLMLAPVGVAVAGLLLPVALWFLFARLARVGAEGRGDVGAHAGSRRVLAGLGVLLVTFALYGLVGGLASSQAFSVGMAGERGAAMLGHSLVRDCLINDAGLLLGALGLLAGTRWLAAHGSGPLALRCVLLPAYLVAIFLTPLMSGYVALLVPLLMAFSQGLFYGLLWLFPQVAPLATDAPTICAASDADADGLLRRLTAALGCFFAGTYAGMWFGGDLLPQLGSGDLYMVAAAVALGLVLALELLPRLVGPRPEAPSAQDILATSAPTEAQVAREALAAGAQGAERLADAAARAWGLTPRERAVLPGLARGRSVAWVAESLTLSRNTVHTHVRNIYQKAGVHSQQELIDAVEALASGAPADAPASEPASAASAPRP